VATETGERLKIQSAEVNKEKKAWITILKTWNFEESTTE